MSVMLRPARGEELQQTQELVVRSINDLTERHGFGPMASVRPATFQIFSLNDDPRGLWIAESDGEIVGLPLAGSATICGSLLSCSSLRACKEVV